MESFTIRDQHDEILGTFYDEAEAFAYASDLANANPDELYAVYGEPVIVRAAELETAEREPVTVTAERLGWARTGTLRSLDHLAVVEAYQNRALCGVAIAGTVEIRPRLSTTWCPRCVRAARKLGVEACDVGIENDLV